MDRAISVLRLIAKNPDGICLSELATSLELNPQTAQSLIRTLQYHGLLEQESRGKPYKIGIEVLFLAKPLLSYDSGYRLADRYVRSLAKKCGEYVALDTLRQGELVMLAEARGSNPITVSPIFYDVNTCNLHSMATGKLLLAFYDDCENIIKKLNLPLKSGKNPHLAYDTLIKQLQSIREKKSVILRRERSDEVSSVAVAVEDTDGKVVAALGIAFPDSKYSVNLVNSFLVLLKEAAEHLAYIPFIKAL